MRTLPVQIAAKPRAAGFLAFSDTLNNHYFSIG